MRRSGRAKAQPLSRGPPSRDGGLSQKPGRSHPPSGRSGARCRGPPGGVIGGSHRPSVGRPPATEWRGLLRRAARCGQLDPDPERAPRECAVRGPARCGLSGPRAQRKPGQWPGSPGPRLSIASRPPGGCSLTGRRLVPGATLPPAVALPGPEPLAAPGTSPSTARLRVPAIRPAPVTRPCSWPHRACGR
jgi:hypothetical protein